LLGTLANSTRPALLTRKRRGLSARNQVDAMNRLSRAASPYLLQHQTNPVDWWEWGSEAFA